MSADKELTAATRLLSELVACPSVNPNNRPFSGPPYGESALVHLLDKKLAAWGAVTSRQTALPGRQNLVAHFAGKDSSKSLMLETHADTVDAENMSIPPFAPAVENGRLYGRGAADAKGPMAAMLLAIKAVLDADGRPPIDLYFVAAANEERGADGAHRLMMEETFRPSAAIVGEPTELAIVNEHKGALRWRITTHGVAAHSSMPSNGVNAIYMMSRLLQYIEGPLCAKLATRNHPRLGPPAISVGTIRGGSQVNIVPAHCQVEVDRRIIPSESLAQATAELTGALAAMAREEPKFKYEMEEIEWYPPLEEDAGSRVARALAESCRRVRQKAEFAPAAWAADSGVYKSYGIPSVVFGPGSIRHAHTADESIALDEVVLAARILTDLIRTFHP